MRLNEFCVLFVVVVILVVVVYVFRSAFFIVLTFFLFPPLLVLFARFVYWAFGRLFSVTDIRLPKCLEPNFVPRFPPLTPYRKWLQVFPKLKYSCRQVSSTTNTAFSKKKITTQVLSIWLTCLVISLRVSFIILQLKRRFREGETISGTRYRVANVLLNFKALQTALCVCAKCNAGFDGASLSPPPTPAPPRWLSAEQPRLAAVERTRLDAKVLYQSESCCTVAWPTDTPTDTQTLWDTHTHTPWYSS